MKLFIFGLLTLCVITIGVSAQDSGCDKESACEVCQKTAYELKFKYKAASCENTHCKSTCYKVHQQWSQPGSVFSAFLSDSVGKCDVCFRAGYCSNAQCTQQKIREQQIIESTVDHTNFTGVVDADHTGEMVSKILGHEKVNFKHYAKKIKGEVHHALAQKKFLKEKKKLSGTLNGVLNASENDIGKDLPEHDKSAKRVANHQEAHHEAHHKAKHVAARHEAAHHKVASHHETAHHNTQAHHVTHKHATTIVKECKTPKLKVLRHAATHHVAHKVAHHVAHRVAHHVAHKAQENHILHKIKEVLKPIHHAPIHRKPAHSHNNTADPCKTTKKNVNKIIKKEKKKLHKVVKHLKVLTNALKRTTSPQAKAKLVKVIKKAVSKAKKINASVTKVKKLAHAKTVPVNVIAKKVSPKVVKKAVQKHEAKLKHEVKKLKVLTNALKHTSNPATKAKIIKVLKKSVSNAKHIKATVKKVKAIAHEQKKAAKIAKVVKKVVQKQKQIVKKQKAKLAHTKTTIKKLAIALKNT